MPHAHGIAWLKNIDKYLNADGSYNDKVSDLISLWMSCSLENNATYLNNISDKIKTFCEDANTNNNDSHESGKRSYTKNVDQFWDF